MNQSSRKYWIEKITTKKLRKNEEQTPGKIIENHFLSTTPAIKLSNGEEFSYVPGKWLLSATVDGRGSDTYRNMREVKPGDIIFHLDIDNGFFGTSRVAKSYFEDKNPYVRPNGEKSESSYKVKLEGFQELSVLLSKQDLFKDPYVEPLQKLLNDGLKRTFYHMKGKNPKYKGLDHTQGQYLTHVPLDLLKVLSDAYKDLSGKEFNIPFNNSNFDDENLNEGGVVNNLEDKKLQKLSDKTNMEKEDLKEIKKSLSDKGQIILVGPPGSGKTYLAKAFAEYFTDYDNSKSSQEEKRFEIVQFHQSYGYEDFVHGIRPITNETGQLTYSLQDGIFKKICHKAKEDKNNNFVIVIDEINRGNLSRIFGELMLLIEYRDEEVTLSNDEKFKIPPNVYLIGTMNSTDRSLAPIDYALRRRFDFYKLMPLIRTGNKYNAPVLAKWLQKNLEGDNGQEILSLFIKLNTELTNDLDEHHQIGHSYFMKKDISEKKVQESVWKRSIMPLLEEYFYSERDKETKLNGYNLVKLKAEFINE